VLDSKKAVLIVVDMQNSFLRDEGAFSRMGLNITYLKSTLKPVMRLVEVCRKVGIPIIFTRYVLRPDYTDAGLLVKLFPAARGRSAMVTGTWDSEIVDELSAQPKDYIIDKTRYSAFYNTNMEVILRGLGVDTVVVCGVTTELCVSSTIRDAFFRDYHIVPVKDAMAAIDPVRHDGAIRNFEYGFGKPVTTDEVVASLTSHPVSKNNP